MRRDRLPTTLLLLTTLALLAACSDDDDERRRDDGGASDDVAGAFDGSAPGVDGSAPGLDGAASPDAGISFDVSGDGPFRALDAVVVREDGGVTWACTPITCAGHLLECGDCVDNDRDGVTDAHDRECLGPCDNTEGPVLLTGVGGERGGPCQSDCYFDFGNGAGNDQCLWDHRCDPLEVSPGFHPEGPACAYDRARVGGRTCPTTQSAQCLDRCRPITPNGCDCFGCCTFPQLAGRGPAGGPGYVWLGSTDAAGVGTCSLDRITDTNACRPCTPVPSCNNTCEACEVCIGRPAPDPSCGRPRTDAGVSDVPRTDASVADVPRTDGGVTPPPDGGTVTDQCAPSVQPCGLAGQGPCPPTFYCITGCCVPSPP